MSLLQLAGYDLTRTEETDHDYHLYVTPTEKIAVPCERCSASLARLIAGRRVICTPSGRDRYGRILATCTAGGRDLSCSQVRYGYAVERYGRLRCGK